ncbi:hypothetical protein ACVWXM_009923 [Bradyrhizobium sp. GM7.3]
MVAAEKLAGAAGAAHYLVMNEQNAIVVTDLADTRIVAVGRDKGSRCGTTDRFHDESEHAFRALGEDLFL